MVTCEVCMKNPGLRTCPLCGRRVCPMHTDSRGRCSVCSQALCRICGESLGVTHCMVCGRLGCIDCLVQIDNVRRVCRECLARVRGRRWPSLGEVRLYTLGARRLAYRIATALEPKR